MIHIQILSNVPCTKHFSCTRFQNLEDFAVLNLVPLESFTGLKCKILADLSKHLCTPVSAVYLKKERNKLSDVEKFLCLQMEMIFIYILILYPYMGRFCSNSVDKV